MWTLASVNRDLDEFIGPKITPITWILNQKCSSENTKMQNFDGDKNFTLGESDFTYFIRQRNQLVIASDNFLGEQTLSPVLQSTRSIDMEEQLKLAHKVIDVANRPNTRI